MRILAIESSCDETAVAIVEDGRRILTDCIASQVALHREYGGVVPEIASRKHIEAIYGLAEQALENTGLTRGELDAVAVTYAPGLIGALLVGVNFAKAAALALDVPLIPVHHIKGHIAANYLAYPDLEPPFLCLVVSGGHTMFVDVEDYTKLRILGGTRDDAAGECFDKVARLLGMPYPGGAALDRAAQGGDPSRYPMPRPHLSGNPLDLSFSGLKTSAVNLIHNAGQKGEQIVTPDLCAAFSEAVCGMLVPRAMLALERRMRRVVLTGMPGCGKSAVLERMADRNIPVWSADKAVAAQYQPGADGWHLMHQRWGNAFFDDKGRVNRSELTNLLAQTPGMRRELERLIHPLVRDAMDTFFSKAESCGATVAVAEVPLWFETGWTCPGADIAVIVCPDEVRHARLRETRGWSEEKIAAVEGWQWKQQDKIAAADLLIHNEGSLEALDREVAGFLEALAARETLRREELLAFWDGLWSDPEKQ